MTTETKFERSISIKAPPVRVWAAIIDPEQASKYHLAPLKTIELREGGSIAYGANETSTIVGQIVRLEPGKRLDHTFKFHYPGTENDPETLVSYQLEPGSDGTRLTLIHSGFPEENQTYANVSSGWPYILDELKKLVE